MTSLFTRYTRKAKAVLLTAALGLLAACDPSAVTSQLGLGGTAKVALLLPKSNSPAAGVAAAAERGVRLAIAGMGEDANIELKVYDTQGEANIAASVASTAIADGAQVIIGPLFAENAIAVGNVAAASGISVLTLSNNPEAAGGNVFILGNTFRNAADRLVSYAFSQGKKRAIVVHAKNIAGNAGRDALLQALAKVGVAPAGVEGYEFTPDGIVSASGRASAKAKATGADVVLLTADFGSGDLQFLAETLPEAGLNPATVQYAGITRWDAEVAPRGLPGIQGGWFTMPDPQRMAAFNSRYKQAYGVSPHPLASVAFDGMAAVGALSAQRRAKFDPASFTISSGFQGAAGIFRFLPGGTNQRGLAVATIRGNEVIMISPAPENFRGAGF